MVNLDGSAICFHLSLISVHGWEEVWTNKKSGTWVRTHPQLTKSIIVLHIWLTVITRGLSPSGAYAISTTTAPTFFATLHASGGFLVTWVDYKFIKVPLTQNLFSHRPNRGGNSVLCQLDFRTHNVRVWELKKKQVLGSKLAWHSCEIRHTGIFHGWAV